jgi:hypothetical protein
MMVCNTQNYWVSGLGTSFGILKTRKHNVSKTGCFHPQVRGGRHLLCWIRNLDTVDPHPPSPPPEDRNRSSFQNVVLFVFRIFDDGQSPETQ